MCVWQLLTWCCSLFLLRLAVRVVKYDSGNRHDLAQQIFMSWRCLEMTAMPFLIHLAQGIKSSHGAQVV